MKAIWILLVQAIFAVIFTGIIWFQLFLTVLSRSIGCAMSFGSSGSTDFAVPLLCLVSLIPFILFPAIALVNKQAVLKANTSRLIGSSVLTVVAFLPLFCIAAMCAIYTLAMMGENRRTVNAISESETKIAVLESINGIPMPTDVPTTQHASSIRVDKQKFPLNLTQAVVFVAFLPDGSAILTASQDGTIQQWNVETGSQTRIFHADTTSPTDAVLLPNGNYLLILGQQNFYASLWDVKTGLLLRNFTSEAGQGGIHHLAFSPDGQYIATSDYYSTVQVWDVQTGSLIQVLKSDPRKRLFVDDIAFSPDGKIIFAGETTVESGGFEAYVWDTRTGRSIHTLFTRYGGIDVGAFSPDGKVLLTANSSEAQLWDAHTGALIRTFEMQSRYGMVTDVIFSADSKFIFTANQLEINLWNVETGQLVRTFAGKHTGIITSIALSPDNKYIVTASMDKTVWIWDTELTDSNE